MRIDPPFSLVKLYLIRLFFCFSLVLCSFDIQAQSDFYLDIYSALSASNREVQQSNSSITKYKLNQMNTSLEMSLLPFYLEGGVSDNIYDLHLKNGVLGLNYKTNLGIARQSFLAEFIYGHFIFAYEFMNYDESYKIEDQEPLSKIFDEKYVSNVSVPGIGLNYRPFSFLFIKGNTSGKYEIFSQNEIDRKLDFSGDRTMYIYELSLPFEDQLLQLKYVNSNNKLSANPESGLNEHELTDYVNYYKVLYKVVFERGRRIKIEYNSFNQEREVKEAFKISSYERKFDSLEVGIEFNEFFGVGLIFSSDQIKKDFNRDVFQSLNLAYKIDESLLGIKFSVFLK